MLGFVIHKNYRGAYTVGYFDSFGRWVIVSTHDTLEEANLKMYELTVIY